MTYPPQQPGQWGQQPDPYGQQPGQNPWGQQPDPYGQSPWGQQPAYQMGPPPPPKKKGGLMAALIIVAILVVGGGGTGLYFLLNKDEQDPGGGGTSTEDGPRAAADAFTEEIQTIFNTADVADVDLEPLKPYLCGDDYQELDESLTEAQEEQAEESSASSPPSRAKVTMSVEDFKETDDGATFNLHREAEGSEHDQKLNVVEEGDNWVVCGLYEEDEPTSPPSTGGGGGNNTDIPNPIPTT